MANDDQDYGDDPQDDATQAVAQAAPEEVDAHRDMLSQALSHLGGQGVDVQGLLGQAGVGTTDPSQMSHGDLVSTTLALAREHPEVVQQIAGRFPEAQGLLVFGAGRRRRAGGVGRRRNAGRAAGAVWAISLGQGRVMQTLIVTGGAGFIGSNFVRYMLGKYPDYRIVVLDALTYAGNLDNLADVWKNPNFTFIQGDINDAALVDNLAQNADAIVNFAAESHNDRAIVDPEAAVRANFNGVFVLLEAARKHKHERFHQVSDG